MSLEAHAQLGSYMVPDFAPGNLEKKVFLLECITLLVKLG
jgi:hypothetical protein